MPSLSGKSRLKRRGGPETQSSVFDLDIEKFEEDRKTQEAAADIRKLYEETKVESAKPPTKRYWTAVRSESLEPMDVEVEDPVQATLKKAARVKKQKNDQVSMPPPAQLPRHRSPTEETEEVEEIGQLEQSKKSSRQASPQRQSSPSIKETQQDGTEVSKDEAFLQAITKASRSKKAVDDLDKEFNQLRIPKPGMMGGTAVVKANVWDASHPDYSIVNDFDDNLRGNFIQIIRKDLMRKDLGRSKPSCIADGRVNYKKFKKVGVVGLSAVS